jgi:hypothetical protein
MPSCLIRGVRSIDLVACNLDESAHFYETAWGLPPAETRNDAHYFRCTSTYHHVLGLHRGAQPTVIRIVFDVADRQSIDLLHRTVSAADSKASAPAKLPDGGGYGFACKDPDGRDLAFVCDCLDQEDAEGCTDHVVDAAGNANRHRVAIETELLTPEEYAHVRRSSVRTLDRERAEGRGCPFVRLGSRIFYRRCDIERYIEAHVHGGEFRNTDDISRSQQPRRRGRPRKPPTDESYIDAQVRDGEFRAADAGPQPRRRRQPHKPPPSEATP